MSDFTNKLSEFLGLPEVKQVQQEINDYITEQYKIYDSTDFVGSDPGGFVRVHYMYSKKGFYHVDLDNAAFEDKEFLAACILMAINDTLVKYGEEGKKIEARVYQKETELYNKLVELAKVQVAKTNSVDEVDVTTKPGKKSYLN